MQWKQKETIGTIPRLGLHTRENTCHPRRTSDMGLEKNISEQCMDQQSDTDMA
jgi:hypothetical protein